MRCFSFCSPSAARSGCWWPCLLIYFCIRYRRRPGDSATPPLTPSSEALEWFWTITPMCIFVVMFLWGAVVYVDAYRAPDEATRIYARRQTMDVEVSTPGGAARDQHAALAPRPARSNPIDVGRRDPQLLRPRFPRTYGRLAQPLHVGLVPADPSGNVSPLLFAILRHESCRHDRHGRRDGAGGVRELAFAARGRIARARGAKGVLEIPLRELP